MNRTVSSNLWNWNLLEKENNSFFILPQVIDVPKMPRLVGGDTSALEEQFPREQWVRLFDSC